MALNTRDAGRFATTSRPCPAGPDPSCLSCRRAATRYARKRVRKTATVSSRRSHAAQARLLANQRATAASGAERSYRRQVNKTRLARRGGAFILLRPLLCYSLAPPRETARQRWEEDIRSTQNEFSHKLDYLPEILGGKSGKRTDFMPTQRTQVFPTLLKDMADRTVAFSAYPHLDHDFGDIG